VHPAVLRLRAVGAARAVQDRDLVRATTDVVAGCRAAVLGRRGLDPDGLGRTQAAAVEAEVRRLAAAELQVAIGVGITEARTLVRAATAPADLAAVVEGALACAEASWPLVRLFHEATLTLTGDQRLLVGQALFGDDPAVAVADRLDPHGSLHHRPWDHPRFAAALAAEVTACRSTDPAAEKERRARAYDARRVTVRVHDDGTATMRITGPAASVVAAGQRVDRAARGVRARGDSRTLDQLRSDSARGILLHGTIALTTTPTPTPDGTGTDTPVEDVDEAPTPRGARAAADTPAEGSECRDHTSPKDGSTGQGPQGGGTEHGSPGHASTPDNETVWSSRGATDGSSQPASAGDTAAVDDGHGEGSPDEWDRADPFDEVLCPADMELLAKVVNGLPTVQLQVVVPFGGLAGGFPLCAHCARGSDLGRPHPPPAPGQHPAHDQRPADTDDARLDGPRPACDQRPADTDDAVLDGPRPAPDGQQPTGKEQRCAGDEGRDPAPPRRGRGRGLVGEVLGPHPFFITDGHARELALLPGTTLHRLVVDPRDGRLVERTITAYRPDTDMRRQVIAADVYNRAPGSRLGAHAGELDHVTPYGWAGGPTSETNLVLLARQPHSFKTDGSWHLTLGARRDLTVTTVLGQVVTTRAHDYRTYLRTREPEDLDARRDLADALTYAALAHQPPAPPATPGRRPPWIRLDWTDDNGTTRAGPSPTHPTLDALLNHDDNDDQGRGRQDDDEQHDDRHAYSQDDERQDGDDAA
jgi:hypothetical protein